MTTITFKEKLELKKTSFKNLEDFLENIYKDTDFSYEQYLESKLQEVRKAPESDFINL